MASSTLFLVLALILLILLLAAAIVSAIGATSISSSIYFGTSNSAFNARQHLTIASALSWSDLAVASVILLIMWTTGGFKHTPLPDFILDDEDVPTRENAIAAYGLEQRMEATTTTQTISFAVLIIIAVIALVIGIEASVAAAAVGSLPILDSPASSAYALAIGTAVLGFVAMLVAIAVAIVYYGFRSERKRELATLESWIDHSKTQLALT